MKPMKSQIRSLVLVFGVLAGPVPAAATDLDLWTTETQPDRIATIEYLMNAFMLLNGGVNVKVTAIDENEISSRLIRARAKGAMPDIVDAGSEVILSLAEELELDTDAASRMIEKIGKGRFFDGALKMLRRPAGEGYFGIPFHGWVQGIWYRADWFESAGLAPPASWKSILAAARYFTDQKSGRYGILIGTDKDAYAEQVFTHLALSNGASQFDRDNNLTFDTPQTVATLEFYKQLSRYTPPGPQTWRARDYYLQGKLAMMFYSTFIMDDLAVASAAANSLEGNRFENLSGARFDPNLVGNTKMIPIISSAFPASYGVLNALGLAKGNGIARSEAVEKLVTFLFRPDSYITWLHMSPGGMLPVLKDIAESENFLRDPGGVFRRYGRDKIGSIVVGLDRIGNFSRTDGKLALGAGRIFVERIIPRMIQKTIFEGKPPTEAVSSAKREMKALLGRN